MKKILSLLSLLMLCVVVVNAEKVIYSWPGGDQANSITLAEGVTVQITGNTSKNIQGANKVTVNGTEYVTMKVSNGAQNTLTLPKKAKGITFYSYINKASDASGLRDSYWKEVAGVNYDAETSGGKMGCFSDGDKTNPDVRSYSFDETDVITFTNAGEQLCYVMEVEYAEEGSEVPVVNNKTIGLIPGVWDVDGARFAAWVWKDSEEGQWFNFLSVSGAYATAIPADATGLILVRLNGESTENSLIKDDGICWNKTADINITDIADNTVFTITGWGENDYTISAPVDLDALKAQLQNAIDAATTLNEKLGDADLAAAITKATNDMNSEEATAASLAKAGEDLNAAATTAAKNALTYAVALAKSLGVDTADAEALLTSSEATALQMAAALKTLVTNAQTPATTAVTNYTNLLNQFNSDAYTALSPYILSIYNAMNGTFTQLKTAVEAFVTEAKKYAPAIIEKLAEYAQEINNATLNADLAAIQAAAAGDDFFASAIAAQNFLSDFVTVADEYLATVKAIPTEGKQGVADLEEKIDALDSALKETTPNITSIALAVRNLVLAVKAYEAANTTYTIAGTKNLTGTENAWDVVATNNMTLDTETGLYTWTAENITVTADAQPEFKVLITDVKGDKTWIPASDGEGDHNWVITPEYLGGEGVYNITITFDAKTQEIGVTGEKVEVEGIIADGTYYVMSANEGTLINAENALDTKGTPITFTFDAATNTYTIEGADFFAGKQWTIADAVEGMTGYYTISNADGFVAVSATLGLEQIADGTADAAVWILLQKSYWEDIVNSTYTVAGTKNLTGTENDWDIVEANQMVLNDKTGLYEKKFKKIAIDGGNQPEFKVVQTNMEGVNTWYPTDDNWKITTDYVGGEGLYDITITFDPSDFKEIGVIAEKRIVFPENAIVYDFEAAADASENPANKNGSAANGQAFFGWENPEKTDSKRQDYKGYEWAEGSLLPEVCHVWRRSDRINGNVADNGGLKCPSDKEMAIDGLDFGDKVIIVYDAENATDKEIIWAIGNGTSEGGPGTVRATATIGGVEAVTGETTIASGAEIVINSVTPAENGSGYIVFQVKKGMIIKQIAVIPAQRYSATFTTNAGWEKAYAYAWSGEGESAVKFLGDWPGTEMTPGNGGNDWKISFIAEEAPEMIIFSNGVDAQTADLDFEDGKAYEYNIPVIPGTYYLYNVAADGYVVGANNWGTRASISKLGGIAMNVVMNNGKYELKTEATYPGKRLGFNGYVDNGDANQYWTIAEVEGQEGVVTLSTDGTKVLFWDGGEATSTSIGDMPATAENAYWKFVTEEERTALFADATAENPADATFLIINPDFSRNANKAVWTGDDFSVGGGDHVSNNAEKWGGNSQTFDIKQQVTLPDGIYRVVWNGFYRYNNTTNNTNDVAAAAHEAGTEVINSFVYLNDKEYPLTSIADEAAVAAFGKMPFSQADASAAFGQGLYEQSAEVTVIAGTLTIGIKKTEHLGTDWTVWDNFRLFYLTSEIPADAYKPAYEAALAAAQAALVDALYANVTGEEKAALEQAIAENTEVEDNADAYKAAIQALETATNAFTGAKGAYDGLVDAKALVAGLSYQYATDAKKSAAESAAEAVATNADDATAKTTALYKAYRQYAESSALLEGVETATDFTSAIVNPKAESAIAAPWNVVKGEGSGGSLDIKNGEPWTDGEDNSTHKYFDGGNWGAQSWDVSQKQEIKLPKGKYQLTVKSRAAGDMTSFVVFAGETKTEMQHIGASGGLFNRGWNDASVEFEMTEAGAITIGVQGVTESQYQWMSFSDFRLMKFEAYEPVYTVAGAVKANADAEEEASFFTTAWSPDANTVNEAEETIYLNDMDDEDGDGIYTKSYENVELVPGSIIYYKVVAEHTWNYLSWGFDGENANYVVNLPEGQSLPNGAETGVFNITFKFNPVTTFTNGWNVDCEVTYNAEATGISSVAAETVNNGNVYNLNGQRVMKAKKGLYIINGKKVMVK